MSARLKVELYQAANREWSYRVIRGARIILTPGETYKTRQSARRALSNLAVICTDDSLTSWVSPLQAACRWALELDRRAHLPKPKG